MKPQANKKKYITLTKPFMAVVCCFMTTLLFVAPTNAYYFDTETSTENTFTAAQLDFRLTNQTEESLIGPESHGEVDHDSVVLLEPDSLPVQYIVTVDPTGGGFCDKLNMEVTKNGIELYDTALPGFSHATTTDFGSWEFEFDLPPTLPANAPGHGDVCEADIVFNGWRADVDTPEESGYTDEERLSVSFTARMVVLNEIYPNPDGVTAPDDREFIELYNNGSTPIDVLGWQISELAGITETFYPIVAAGAVAGEVQPYNGGSTIIPSGGFIVLEFGGGASHLNNGGDTVRLYDGSTTLLDGHTYPNTAAGKSHVRVLDGIGSWVDPEPTPGKPNEVTEEDLRLAGYGDEEIALLLELARLRNQQFIVAESEKEMSEVIETPLSPQVLSAATSTASTTQSVATSTKSNLDEETEDKSGSTGGSGGGGSTPVVEEKKVPAKPEEGVEVEIVEETDDSAGNEPEADELEVVADEVVIEEVIEETGEQIEEVAQLEAEEVEESEEEEPVVEEKALAPVESKEEESVSVEE